MYGLFACLIFLAAFKYVVGFVGNWVVPKGIDDGTPGAVVPSLLLDGLLLLASVAHRGA